VCESRTLLERLKASTALGSVLLPPDLVY